MGADWYHSGTLLAFPCRARNKISSQGEAVVCAKPAPTAKLPNYTLDAQSEVSSIIHSHHLLPCVLCGDPESVLIQHELSTGTSKNSCKKLSRQAIYLQRDVLLGGYSEYGRRTESELLPWGAVFGGGAERLR